MVERLDASNFSFAVIATKLEDGLRYHVSHAQDVPHVKYCPSLVLPSVPAERLFDDAFWMTKFLVNRCDQVSS